MSAERGSDGLHLRVRAQPGRGRSAHRQRGLHRTGLVLPGGAHAGMGRDRPSWQG